jgi:ERCC4-type nuclease
MIIKVDNRETDLLPLIERRIDTIDILEKETAAAATLSATIKNKVSSGGGGQCLVPLHIYQDVDFVEKECDGTSNTNETPKTGENEKSHKIKKEQLHIGDIVLEDNAGKQIIVFERKTLNDLAASIKDGRYNEQSFRLDKEAIHNHNIVYIIEGDIERYNEKRGRISKKVLISSMFSLLYYKGFSVFRTNSICETADVIVFFADKYDKTLVTDKSRRAYYGVENAIISTTSPTASPTSPPTPTTPCSMSRTKDKEESEKYCGVFKSHKEKNEYITQDNINIIMLACVPGISSKIATQIMNEYKTIQNLLHQLEKEPDILNTFMVRTDSGAMRKINKTCVDNIKKFLLRK